MKVFSFYKNPFFTGTIVFAALLLLTQFITYQRYLIFQSAQQRELNSVATLARERLQTTLSNALSATQTLAFIVKEYGVPNDFDELGQEILASNKHIDAIQLVEGEVITQVYPLDGNEAAIGYNILRDTLRNKEAIKAILKRELFFAGPFQLKQGYVAVVGRLPIFEKDKYKGLAAVIIKLSTLIKAAEIDTSDNANYLFQLSKINPETGEEEFFLPNPEQFVHKHSVSIDVPNGSWKLYVMHRNSQVLISPIPFSLLGLLLSFLGGVLAWFATKQPLELKKLVDEKTKALSDSEENYRSTLARVSDAFVALDKNWNYTFINKKAAEMHGRLPEELLGKNMWEEFPYVKDEPFYDALHKAMETQQPMSVELYYSKHDRWFQDYIYPSQNGITIYYRDVTEQKKITEEINSERILSENILKSLPGVFYMFNEKGEYQRWNDNLSIVTGYSHEEIKHMHPIQFFDDDEKGLLIEKITNVFKSGFDEVEANFVTKSGEKIPYFFNGFRVELQGKLNLIGVGIDLTARRKAEQEMKTSNERFKLVSKATNDIVWDWNLQTNEIWWNENYYRYLGYEQKHGAEKIEDTWSKHIHPEDKARVEKGIYDAIQKGSYYWTDDYRFFKADGSIVNIYDRGYIIFDANNKPYRMVGAMLDITKIRNAEQEVRRSQIALRQLSAHLQSIREEERTYIAREIHDELGQQLTCLKMDASWLNKKVDKSNDDVTERIKGMIEMIDDTVKTVRRIAADLRPGILDDLGLIAALEWQCHEFEKRTGIQSHFECLSPDTDFDKNTATGVFRVYQEILTNVARHSKATAVQTKVECTDNLLILQVHDNGVGFDAAAVKEKHTLGLLGMNERVAMFNGEIDIASENGNGTIITIKAPILLATEKIV